RVILARPQRAGLAVQRAGVLGAAQGFGCLPHHLGEVTIDLVRVVVAPVHPPANQLWVIVVVVRRVSLAVPAIDCFEPAAAGIAPRDVLTVFIVRVGTATVVLALMAEELVAIVVLLGMAAFDPVLRVLRQSGRPGQSRHAVLGAIG